MASKDVCDALDINRSTLTRWVGLGKIQPIYRLPGDRGAFLFDPAAVELLRAENKAAA